MPVIHRIDHIAILVDEMEEALSFWHDCLGLELTHTSEIPAEQAQVAFLPVGDGEIELVRPTMLDSGLARFLQKRGPGMHHICLEVDDLQAMLDHLKSKGVQLINEQPRQGDNGRKYAFIHPKSANGVMVELYEIPESSTD